MTIAKKKPTKEARADAFIDAAPDAGATPPAAGRSIKSAGKKSIITVSISPDVLAGLDGWAAARGMSRASAIAFACSLLPQI